MWKLEVFFETEAVILIGTGHTQLEARQNILKNWNNNKISEYIFPYSKILLKHALQQNLNDQKDHDGDQPRKKLWVWDGTYKQTPTTTHPKYRSPLNYEITPEDAKMALTNIDQLKSELEQIAKKPQHSTQSFRHTVFVNNMQEAIQKGYLECIEGTLFVSASSE